jgi:hypothetical protein
MRLRTMGCVGLVLALSAACSSEVDEEDDSGSAIGDFPEGAIVDVSMDSTVGVLLDDLAALPAAEAARIEADVLSQPLAFWQRRARMQLRLTTQRQYFRHLYHGPPTTGFEREKATIANPVAGQLPLPPMVDPNGNNLWTKDITIALPPKIETIDGHKLAVVRYSYKGSLLTDKDSPARSDKELAVVGGKVAEPHQLPVDPDLLRQRTGLACLTETEFPANSVDSENAWRFFEQSCTRTDAECHSKEDIQGGNVREDCEGALRKHIGLVKTELRFERKPYQRSVADRLRVGTVSKDKKGRILKGADMTVRKDDLAINRLVWKYVSHESCEVQESEMSDNRKVSCVVRPDDIERDGGGWRHVLMFNATGYNVGSAPVHIGNINYFVENVDTQVEDHGVFELSSCHRHYHFKHYGDFLFSGGTTINKKNGFCLESTTRYSNNELTPIFTEYGRCIHQGVEVGWGDEYEAGLTCQWVDVTDAKPGSTSKLGFLSNPDGFLCEGTLKSATNLNERGNPTPDSRVTQWERTEFKTDDGKPVDRPACDFQRTDWKSNNKAEVDVTVPTSGGLVSHACRLDGEPNEPHWTFGPLRDCGLRNAGATPSAYETCTPGETVELSCRTAGASTQVLRVCEASHVVGGAIDCLTPAAGSKRNPWDAMAEAVVSPTQQQTVSFTCPGPRDKKELGGRYSIYAGAYVAGATDQPITCERIK